MYRMDRYNSNNITILRIFTIYMANVLNNLIKFNLIHGIQSTKRDCQRRELWR